MAIAIGLFAGVMSGWDKSGCFTYGSGRVEALGGFANGIHLILISVFIAFEAVQRLLVSVLILISSDANYSYRLDPPEMNTRQPGQLRRLGVNLCQPFRYVRNRGTLPPCTNAFAHLNPVLSY